MVICLKPVLGNHDGDHVEYVLIRFLNCMCIYRECDLLQTEKNIFMRYVVPNCFYAYKKQQDYELTDWTFPLNLHVLQISPVFHNGKHTKNL